jgi:uncharacterized protein (DUF305 family)
VTVRALAVPVTAAAFIVAGCGSGQTSSSTFNNTDVTFSQQMILHHEQAIEMADIAATHAQSPQVKQLAAQIKAEQGPQIQVMAGWLRAWGKPVPSEAPGMNVPDQSQIPGMMSVQEMERMDTVHGTAFDHTFLGMMIGHHEGAVAMAKREQAAGANSEAKRLAQQIETTQTSQIYQMQQLLNGMH